MEGSLADFFREHREEIVEMGVYEFDQELHDRVLLEDGEAIGVEKGIEIGRTQGIEIGRFQGMEIGRSEGMTIGISVYRKIQAGETDDRVIAESCGCWVEEVEAVRRQLKDGEAEKSWTAAALADR